MPQFEEPLYVGIDLDAVEARLEEAERLVAARRRAGARRSAPQRNPWLAEFETSHNLDAMIDPEALTPRAIPLA